LPLYASVGWLNYTNNPQMLKKVLDEYQSVYQLHLLTENTEKTIQFYKSLGFTMDTDIDCRAFSKYHID